MELSFVTTPEQAKRLSELQRSVSFSMKRDRFEALGLGLRLGDQREALIDLDGRAKLWRLVRVDYDMANPAVVGTGWVLARPAMSAMLLPEDDPRSAFPAGDPQPVR